MDSYAQGQLDAALAFGFDKEAASDIYAKLRAALLAVPLATGIGMSKLPPPIPVPGPAAAYRGTERHYADTQQSRGRALMDKIKAEQAVAAAPTPIAAR